ncbi:uncharacterized protein LOC122721246 isoform X2 [Manihot esculenta]|nr:uncharacterized protein LOC122721246 isoform X2 [Manihot esculenta]
MSAFPFEALINLASMTTLNPITSHQLSVLINPVTQFHKHKSFSLLSTRRFRKPEPLNCSFLSTHNRNRWAIGSITEDREAVPFKDSPPKDQDNPSLLTGSKGKGEVDDDNDKLLSRAINATIVLGFGTVAVSKLLTVDHDYWHGWTLYEVLRYAPEHNWIAYEQALKTNPVLAKMAISGIVYSIGDWIAQCYEGKPLFEFDLTRMFRSGLVGFTLHGSLSHYYYQFCEALFPFEEWWVVPAKVAFDQTIWSAVWNSIYFTVLGFLRLESPENIFSELRATFWPMLTAGWKLWPFAHLITYGLIPVEQRLLWVDCVELIWVTILSTYSNEKSEARISEATLEESANSTSNPNEAFLPLLPGFSFSRRN